MSKNTNGLKLPNKQQPSMNVALVYDRVNKWGGAERVLLALHELFPRAPLFTTVYNPKTAPWASVFDVRTSFLQNIPFGKSNHEWFPYLSALAFEQFNFDDYDVVISVTSAEAKGIITKPGTLHICYCLTPTRYLWSHYDTYFENPVFRFLTKPLVNHMREWDLVAASRPDRYIAISNTVKERIKTYYGRDSEVIYPPVEMQKSKIKNQNDNVKVKNIPDDYFLVVSRLVSYKHVDLAIDACRKAGKPLIVVGSGSEESALKRLPHGNVTFVKNATDEELNYYYQNALALIMPQEEDFGLVAVEAQAAGTPVIAYRAGGVLDTVKEGETGLLFENQTVNSLVNALKKFETMKFSKAVCEKNAERFEKKVFKEKFRKSVEKTYNEYSKI